MWPWVIEQPFRVGSYGVMMAIGFLTAWWLLARDLRRRGIDPAVAETTIFLGVTSGLIGAKLAYLFTEAPSFEWSDLWSGSGLTWHGGLILAATVIIAYYLLRRLPLRVMVDAVAPTLASGYGFGRIGCHLAGDGDFGIPCAPGWWHDVVCMAYPNGMVPSPCEVQGFRYDICPLNAPDPTWLSVHPTPVYEALGAFALFGLLWFLRKRIRIPGMLSAIYLVLAGLSRFAVEFIRLSEARPDRFLGLRDAQVVALGMVLLGVVVAAATAVLSRAGARSVPPDRP
jgi:phosphatidylglycerol:prolipoprotein diacylglycerol transferase